MQFGMLHLLCWTRLGGLDQGKVLACMELMQQQVIPHVKTASAAQRLRA